MLKIKDKIVMKVLGMALGIGVILTMRFCDSIEDTLKNLNFDEIKKDFDKKLNKAFGIKDKMMYIIGSGSHFEFLYNCDYDHAYQEYKKMSVFYSTGSLVDSVSRTFALLEKYYAMESSTGYVYCYILPIDGMHDMGIKLVESED